MRGPGAAERQRDALVAEGVEVNERAGGFAVDLRAYGWFPAREEVGAVDQEDGGNDDGDGDGE